MSVVLPKSTAYFFTLYIGLDSCPVTYTREFILTSSVWIPAQLHTLENLF